jgi:hypothetical protein
MGRYIQSVDDTRNVAQNGQKDVDQEIRSTSALEENTKRWEEDGKTAVLLAVATGLTS